MTLYWIIHNPIDGRALIDIQPEPIDDREYQYPIKKGFLRGETETTEIKNASRMVFDISLPKESKMPDGIYEKDDGSSCPDKAEVSIQREIDAAIGKYIEAHTPVAETVDYVLVEQIKNANTLTKNTIKNVVAVSVSAVEEKIDEVLEV